MAAITDKVLNDVLSLPADARMSLVEKLLASLNLPTQAEIDRLWVEEAERRVSKIEATWNSYREKKSSRKSAGSTGDEIPFSPRGGCRI